MAFVCLFPFSLNHAKPNGPKGAEILRKAGWYTQSNIDLPHFQGVHRLKMAAIFMKLLAQSLKSFICSMMEIRFAQ